MNYLTRFLLIIILFGVNKISYSQSTNWIKSGAGSSGISIAGSRNNIHQIETFNDNIYIIGNAAGETIHFDGQIIPNTLTEGENADPIGFLSKMNKQGDLLWTKIFKGILNYDLDIDQNENIIVIGYGFDEFFPYWNSFMSKYDKDGNLIFTQNILLDLVSPELNAIAIDKSDNIYISGIYGTNQLNTFEVYDTTVTISDTITGNESNAFILQFDNDGNFIHFEHLLNSESGIYDIKIDDDYNILALGSFISSIEDSLIIGENHYSSGHFTNFYNPARDAFLIQYNSDWSINWVNIYNSYQSETLAKKIDVNKNGDIAVVTNFSDSIIVDGEKIYENDPNLGKDILVTLLNIDGDLIWKSIIGGKFDERKGTVFIDDDFNIYVGGGFYNTAKVGINSDTLFIDSESFYDAGFIVKYKLSGELEYAESIKHGTSEINTINKIGSDIILGGSFHENNDDLKFLDTGIPLEIATSVETIKNFFVISFEEDEISTGQDYNFSKNINIYPNPTKEKLNIDGLDQELNLIELQLIDAHGKIVYRKNVSNVDFLHNLILPTIPSGIYTLSIVSKNSYYSERFIKL